MELQEIQQRKARILAEDGPWTAHNLHLGHGEFTISPKVSTIELRAKRFVQMIADMTRKPMSELRVLDLGSCEGLYSIELGMQGCEVVGVEARDVHLRKSEFAREALGLGRVSFRQGDVRTVLADPDLGTFDVSICAGLLYHLPQEDLLQFLRQLRERTQHFVIFDTHVTFTPTCKFEAADGTTYLGHQFTEHAESSSPEERLANVWASVDNTSSFWPTRASLLNMLMACGYSSVVEAQVPVTYDQPDRVTFVAFCGERSALRSVPDVLNTSVELVAEAEPGKESSKVGIVRRLVNKLIPLR